MDKWVAAKGERTMGYFTREDIPYQYALADAFTICDGYFCSMNGPTDPNRLYLWSGTAGPGRDGTTGPWTDNTPVDGQPGGRLDDLRRAAGEGRRQLAGLPQPRRLGRARRRLRRQRAVVLQAVPRLPEGRPAVRQRDDQVRPDGVRPALQGRHPAHGLLARGAVPVLRAPGRPARTTARTGSNTALQSLFANPEVWEHTVFLLKYDENDGYFDHVIPPYPEPGTPDEFVGGKPIGLGSRVPLLGRLAVVARRLGQLPGLRPHLGAALPGARHRRARSPTSRPGGAPSAAT